MSKLPKKPKLSSRFVLWAVAVGAQVEIGQSGKGQVFLKSPSQFSFEKLDQKHDLSYKDAVYVGDDSYAIIRFSDQQIPSVRVHENSIVVITKPEDTGLSSSQSSANTIVLKVRKGKIIVQQPAAKNQAQKSSGKPLTQVMVLPEGGTAQPLIQLKDQQELLAVTKFNEVLPEGLTMEDNAEEAPQNPAPLPIATNVSSVVSAPKTPSAPELPATVPAPSVIPKAPKKTTSASRPISRNEKVAATSKATEKSEQVKTKNANQESDDSDLAARERSILESNAWSLRGSLGVFLHLIDQSGTAGEVESYALPIDSSLALRYNNSHWSSGLQLTGVLAAYPQFANDTSKNYKTFGGAHWDIYWREIGLEIEFSQGPIAEENGDSYSWDKFSTLTAKLLWRRVFLFRQISQDSNSLWMMETTIGPTFPFLVNAGEQTGMGWGIEGSLQGWAPKISLFSGTANFRLGPAIFLSYNRFKTGESFSTGLTVARINLSGRIDF